MKHLFLFLLIIYPLFLNNNLKTYLQEITVFLLHYLYSYCYIYC
nr:MAG TPA: hypothetical protein [Bacteriophage sp.]